MLLYDTVKFEKFSAIARMKHPFCNKYFVVYQFNCPCCCTSYVGNTETTLHERCTEHTCLDKTVRFGQIEKECEGVKHINNLPVMNMS